MCWFVQGTVPLLRAICVLFVGFSFDVIVHNVFAYLSFGYAPTWDERAADRLLAFIAFSWISTASIRASSLVILLLGL